ncbi:hydrogenase large subunit [Geobacter pickeringii]|uniref:Hydrogenase n=1 Tax=Geobacter pickeringii TaxID=345632 RepID=A0A0B5B7U7_9BACT|nr:NADH-quinone oxidoreductase subunit C [Geobacter pickeringii]AJE02623.1 hydrogenase [Geobacter pickeringii]
MTVPFRTFPNGAAVPFGEVPRLEATAFLQAIIDATDRGWRVSSYFGIPTESGATLCCVLSSAADGVIGVATADAVGAFPSIARLVPQVQLFEREIAEQCGIPAEGHPWFKPVRFHRSFVPGRDAWGRAPDDPILPGVMEFYRVEGEEVHEVAVGPVHAGIIEPGHFRFQCHGEEVFHLEISLGYQHRGVERGLAGGPDPRTPFRMETIAGDTTIGHMQAYCMVMEALAGVQVPTRAEALRGIALELERLANHTGDLGAIAGDVGYLPTSSFCGRIRGDFLTMTAVLCGSRFGRGLLRPGGVLFDLGEAERDDLLARLAAARTDLENAVELLWSTPSVMSRLENTGTVSADTARDLGLVGPAARACGLDRDVRRDHPFGIYRTAPVPLVTAHHGDVCARTTVRWQEAVKSLDFIHDQLRYLPEGGCRGEAGNLQGNRVAVALTEGWRGEICHVAITDHAGRFLRYKVTDPSFHNWQGLAMALRGEQISDFPLCNKSFNLSYCGFDL